LTRRKPWHIEFVVDNTLMTPGQTKLVAAVARIAIAATACACVVIAGAACAPTATGGAVELSWKLRPASGPLLDNTGPFIDCNSGEPGANPVKYIQLSWTDGDEVSTPPPFWNCEDGHGVTGFDLPAGTALITISPLCDGGSAANPATYQAPAPIERDVSVGDTISLDAVELVLQVSSCTAQPCICQ
jgi:hypothetical protein